MRKYFSFIVSIFALSFFFTSCSDLDKSTINIPLSPIVSDLQREVGAGNSQEPSQSELSYIAKLSVTGTNGYSYYEKLTGTASKLTNKNFTISDIPAGTTISIKIELKDAGGVKTYYSGTKQNIKIVSGENFITLKVNKNTDDLFDPTSTVQEVVASTANDGEVGKFYWQEIQILSQPDQLQGNTLYRISAYVKADKPITGNIENQEGFGFSARANSNKDGSGQNGQQAQWSYANYRSLGTQWTMFEIYFVNYGSASKPVFNVCVPVGNTVYVSNVTMREASLDELAFILETDNAPESTSVTTQYLDLKTSSLILSKNNQTNKTGNYRKLRVYFTSKCVRQEEDIHYSYNTGNFTGDNLFFVGCLNLFNADNSLFFDQNGQGNTGNTDTKVRAYWDPDYPENLRLENNDSKNSHKVTFTIGEDCYIHLSAEN